MKNKEENINLIVHILFIYKGFSWLDMYNIENP